MFAPSACNSEVPLVPVLGPRCPWALPPRSVVLRHHHAVTETPGIAPAVLPLSQIPCTGGKLADQGTARTGEWMSLGSWPFLPSLGCVMWIVPIKADGHTQGCLLAKTPSVQSITLSVCAYRYFYIYFYIYIKITEKKYINKNI